MSCRHVASVVRDFHWINLEKANHGNSNVTLALCPRVSREFWPSTSSRANVMGMSMDAQSSLACAPNYTLTTAEEVVEVEEEVVKVEGEGEVE